MKKSIAISVCLLGAAGIYWFAQAGEMEPPGPPAPTMVTLQEIYDKLDECTGGGLCGVPKTGQKGCWDRFGNPIDCDGTGQDGEYQAGVSVDPRFAGNGDGTVTDNLTGLIWLRDANCFGQRNWANALSDANGLQDGSCGLTDGSVAGDWRLPNIRELQTLFDHSQHDPALPLGYPFSGVQTNLYWSSTSDASFPANARHAWFLNGGGGDFPKTAATVSVWPVRDAPGGERRHGARRPFAPAGDLDPPGPPAPTMVTLQQIYDKVDECTGGGMCGVPKTGQTGCWDLSGDPIDCAGTGQDGEYQTGVSADPRFTDNDDGTVTDNLTGFVVRQRIEHFVSSVNLFIRLDVTMGVSRFQRSPSWPFVFQSSGLPM
jgi:cytochrome c5